jgi:hypothetical protein
MVTFTFRKGAPVALSLIWPWMVNGSSAQPGRMLIASKKSEMIIGNEVKLNVLVMSTPSWGYPSKDPSGLP